MILIYLITLVLNNNEKKLTAKLNEMLRQLDYDSVVVDYDRNLFNSGIWKKEKLLHPGTNFIRIEQEDRIKIVSVKVELYRKSPVLLEYVKRSGHITKTDYHFKMVDVTYLDGVLSKRDLELGRYAKRSLKKGSILTEDNTREEYDVRFGDYLDLVYKSKNIKLVIKAKSKKDAFIGDCIFLELSSGKRLKATLIKKGQAIYEKN